MIEARRYLLPYLRLVPIWRFGPVYGLLEGQYIREGWSPDRYGDCEITRETAVRLESGHITPLEAFRESKCAG